MTEGIRVLYTGCDSSNFDHIRLTKANDSLTVTTESTSENGLRRLDQDDIDCVVSDVTLSDTSGVEFLVRVRETHPNCPFILLVDPTSDIVTEDAIPAGVTDCFPPDADPDQYPLLETRISNAVTHARARQRDTRSLSYYQTLLENAADYVMVVDTAGQVEYVSSAVERVLGYSPTELKNMDAFETIHPDDYDIAVEGFEAVLTEPDQDHTVEYRSRNADGEWRWLEVRGRNHLDDPVIDGIIVTVRDITDRKQHGQDLKRYEQLITNLPVGVFRTTLDGEIINTNPRFVSIYEGESEASFADVSATELYVDDDDRTALVTQLETNGVVADETIRMETLEGNQRLIETTIQLVEEDGQQYLDGIVQDVTERRTRERRFEALFNDPNILVGLIDTDGTVLDINETAMEHIEPGLDALLGEPFWKTPWFENDEAVQQEVRDWIDRAAAGEYVEFEADLSRSVGHPLVVSGAFRPVRDEKGEVVSLLISDRDVTERKQRQRELELRNRAIEEAPLGITIADAEQADNPLVYANDEFEQITGYSADGITGQNCRILQGEETSPEPVARMREAIDRAERVTVQLRNYRANGEQFWNRVSIAPVRDDSGAVTNYVGFQQDISERKARQEVLRRNERRFEAMFNDPHLLIGLLDDDGTLLDANETAMEYIDADLSGVTGRDFWETPWWSEDLRPAIKEHVERAAAGEYVTYEADLTYPNGDPYNVVGVIRPVKNANGEVDSLIFSARSITERKQREQELAKSEARYQSLTDDVLDTSGVGTFILGPDFEVVWTNQAVEEYFGLERHSTIGKDKSTLIREHIKHIFEDSERFSRRVLATYEDNTMVEEFECHVLPDGNRDERWLQHWSQPIESGLYEGGRIEHYTDITGQKKREQQLAAMDRVLRHNIQNEMNIILGNAETLAETTTGEIKMQAQMIAASGRQLLEMTAKQRNIVELLSEKPDLTTVDVSRIVRQCIRELSETYPDTQFSITAADKVQAQAVPELHQAICELVENAIVHNDTAEPTVDVKVDSTEENICVQVIDTGPVIPEAERAILRGEAEDGPLYHGSGMGLWLVNWIVVYSDGTVTHAEREPRGNIVEILIPK